MDKALFALERFRIIQEFLDNLEWGVRNKEVEIDLPDLYTVVIEYSSYDEADSHEEPYGVYLRGLKLFDENGLEADVPEVLYRDLYTYVDDRLSRIKPPTDGNPDLMEYGWAG